MSIDFVALEDMFLVMMPCVDELLVVTTVFGFACPISAIVTWRGTVCLCSQFHFHSQSNHVFDDGRQGEDGTIIGGMFVVGQKVISPFSDLSAKFR